MTGRLRILIFTILSLPLVALGNFEFTNITEVQRALNFNAYYGQPLTKKMKVAIFDKGFDQAQNAIGKSLPQSTYIRQMPLASPTDLKVEHGRVMGEILTALMTNNGAHPELAPELHLFQVFGFTNFKSAVDTVVKDRFDLVLYSEVWEFGSNWDGQGFINAEVNRAIDNGIFWVNAAGNFARSTFNSDIRIGKNDWVQLPHQNSSLGFRCLASKCNVRIVLSWNDFKNSPDEGTAQDLDLALSDDLMNIIESSALKQSADRNESRPGFSKYSRESIVKEISKGDYFLRVKARSSNFTSNSQLRITLEGENTELPNRSYDETLLNPADNPRAFTVGALDSDRSSQSYRLQKPDVIVMSSVKTPQGEFRGTSNSAAFAAAAISLARTVGISDSINSIVGTSRLTGWNKNQRGLSLQWLGFMPLQNNCFAATNGVFAPHIQEILNVGGKLVATNRGYRMMVPFDPIRLDTRLSRQWANDMILATPSGFKIFPRNQTAGLPNDWVEVFQTPTETTLCQVPNAFIGDTLRLNLAPGSNDEE
jgi:hypothetical protein